MFHLLLVVVLQLCVQEIQSDGLPEVDDLSGRQKKKNDVKPTGAAAAAAPGRDQGETHFGPQVGMQQHVAVGVDGEGVAVGPELFGRSESKCQSGVRQQ